MFTPEELGELADEGQLLLRDRDEFNFDTHFPIRGSALGGCNRQLAMRTTGLPVRPVTAKQLRTFEVGHQREAGLLAAMTCALRERGIYYEVQPRVLIPTDITGQSAIDIHSKALEWVEDDASKLPLALIEFEGTRRLHIKGSIDLLVYDMHVEWREEDGKWIPSDVDGFRKMRECEVLVVDTKTKHPWGMKQLDVEGVDYGYGVQLSAYGLALEALGHPKVSMLVYYEHKGDQTRKVKPVDWEVWRDPLAGAIEDKQAVLTSFLTGLQENVAESFAPKKDKKGNWVLPWQCNYCSLGPIVANCHKEWHWHNSVGDPTAVPKWAGVPQ